MMLPEDKWLSFTESLYNFITCNKSPKHNVIIKKHSESLNKNGDFSFPTQLQPWLPHISKCSFANEKDFENHFRKCCQIGDLIGNSAKWSLNIVSMSESSNRVNIFINRSTAVKACILQCIESDEKVKSYAKNMDSKIFIDSTNKSEDSLIDLRLNLIGSVLKNLLPFTVEDDGIEVMVTARSCNSPKTLSVLCGPVLNMKTSKKEVNISAQDYMQIRQTEMTLIAQHKYGLRDSNSRGWKTLMSKLGEAAVKFDLLQMKPAAPIKINFDNPASSSSKGAAFVLYNCARLETLLKTFQDKVDGGQYPALPSFDDVDFTLLNDEDEWSLVWNYVLAYPSLVNSCLRVEGSSLVASPHHLCNFLSSLVRIFSQYYRRVRVLVEGRTHLVPLVYARIYLLKALQIIMRTLLKLLNIDFVTQM